MESLVVFLQDSRSSHHEQLKYTVQVKINARQINVKKPDEK